jgi:hypothetical protein
MGTIEQLEALERAAIKPYRTMTVLEEDSNGGRKGDCRVWCNHEAGRCLAVFKHEPTARLYIESRNALPSLLAVAKAAKLVKAANARRANAQVQDCCVREDYEQSMGHACDQLTRALEQLEATP